MNEHAGHRARLRESFLENGLEGMADHQVLELLLTYALPRVDVNPLAHRLLERFGSLEQVLQAPPEQLQQIRGIGASAAVYLSLVGQVHRRMLLQRYAGQGRRPVLGTPSALSGYLLALAMSDRYETLRLICLNRKYELIYEGPISSGSLTEVLADPRRILETALVHKASFIALGHNHPSGDLTPSSEDRAAARQIDAAAEAVGIRVLDQFVLGCGAAYSMHNERVLRFDGPDRAQEMSLEEYAGRR